MDKKKSIVLAAVVVVVLVLLGSYLALGQEKDKGIVGMYNISEYHQYSMDNGTFIHNHSGDGTYDSEFIEITSCIDGIFEGYCCVPTAGEQNPPHYPILGTYDAGTGMIQYTCSYNYPSSGLYDWLHGFIVDGVMQLSGITFGDDNDYYGAFQFTFVKQGCKAQKISYDPIFAIGDAYRSFTVIESLDEFETESIDTVAFGVKDTCNSLYRMDFRMPGSDKPVTVLGSTLSDGIAMGIGYEDGKAFSLLITDLGDYVQINREYAFYEYSATWTAYLTKDGREVPLKDVPEIKDLTFVGIAKTKKIGGDVRNVNYKDTFTSVTDALMEITTENSTKLYGNIVPYGNGYIVAVSDAREGSDGITYNIGFIFLNGKMDSLYYSGLFMSTGGELNVVKFVSGEKT